VKSSENCFKRERFYPEKKEEIIERGKSDAEKRLKVLTPQLKIKLLT
jgi:hypothetical protein